MPRSVRGRSSLSLAGCRHFSVLHVDFRFVLQRQSSGRPSFLTRRHKHQRFRRLPTLHRPHTPYPTIILSQPWPAFPSYSASSLPSSRPLRHLFRLPLRLWLHEVVSVLFLPLMCCRRRRRRTAAGRSRVYLYWERVWCVLDIRSVV